MKQAYYITLSLLVLFCSKSEFNKTSTQEKSRKFIADSIESEFNKYWYAGKAEITSYKLLQSRYGQTYEGTAVNIFVTEDFLAKKQVKADYKNDLNIPILKLNSTKKFETGIYPYSMMTSTFSPINLNKKAIKISFSAQEWCGNTFVQLNNKIKFDINFYSYFENNYDRKITLKKDVLENHIWNSLRINPYRIKKGKYKIIPSFEFLAMNHLKIKAYEAEVNLLEKDEFIYLSINYPNLKREITIRTTNKFPYIIESWEEVFIKKEKKLVTTAKKIKTIQSAYWKKNGVTDTKERKILGL